MFKDAPGVIDGPEQQFLYEQALNCLTQWPSCWFLEIGSFTGNTARCFAQAIKENGNGTNYVVCVDPFYGHYDEGLTKILEDQALGPSSWVKFNENVGDLIDYIIPIATPTKRAQHLLTRTQITYGICFIDGDHSTEAATHDLNFAHLLDFHSIILHDASWGSVNAAIEAYVKRYDFTYSWHCGDAFAKIDI